MEEIFGGLLGNSSQTQQNSNDDQGQSEAVEKNLEPGLLDDLIPQNGDFDHVDAW